MEPNVETVNKLMDNLSTNDAVDGEENVQPRVMSYKIAVDKRASEKEKEPFIKLTETRVGHGGQRSCVILSTENAQELTQTVIELNPYLVPGSEEAVQLLSKAESSEGENVGEVRGEVKGSESQVKGENEEDQVEKAEEALPDNDDSKTRAGGRRRSKDNVNMLKRVRIDHDDERKYNVDLMKATGAAQPPHLYLKISQTSSRQRLRQRSIIILPNLKAVEEFTSSMNTVLKDHSTDDKPLTFVTEELETDGVHTVYARVGRRGQDGKTGGRRSQKGANKLTTPELLKHAKDLGTNFVPSDQSFRSINQNKNFYCDFSVNERGMRLRITEVTNQFRSYITVPLRCWPLLRDIMVSTCEQAEAAGLFNASEHKDKPKRRARAFAKTNGNRKKEDSESTVIVNDNEQKVEIDHSVQA